MNVRKVKESMWTLIDQDHKNSSTTSEKENEENDCERSARDYTFNDMREELKSVLTGDTRENLTPAMSLVCLLYLANEKGLELKQEPGNLSNFAIVAPKDQKT